jgi:peptide deformylase
MKLKILPAEQIPKDIGPTPEGNLLELYKLFLHMENACLESNGVGLSAPQVGIPWKLFICLSEFDKAKPICQTFRYFVNCEYEPLPETEKVVSVEGCLSLKNKDGSLRHFRVGRHKSIFLRGRELIVSPDLFLREVGEKVENCFFGIVLQHEIDHCHSVLISDIGEEMVIW